MKNYNWTCRYCNMPQVATITNIYHSVISISVGVNKYGKTGCSIVAISCQNIDCREIDLKFDFISFTNTYHINDTRLVTGSYEIIQKYELRPESTAKPQPDYIPKPILADYYEACRIVELSPKASATLSRRCLQGMIRDFCKISEKTLY